MRIIGLLSWWNESPQWLQATVASMSKICTHVVAVDGHYADYDDPRRFSPMDQITAIHEAARSTGMGVTVHSSGVVWATEMDKRTRLFELGSLEAETFTDWFFVLDADEVLIECDADAVRGQLAETDLHVGVGALMEHTDPYETVEKARASQKLDLPTLYDSPTPRFWRALRDMRVAEKHYYYTGVDESGKRLPLWGQQAQVNGEMVVLGSLHDDAPRNLVEWLHFAPGVVTLENRCLFRSKERTREREAYYYTRDAAGYENQSIPKEWANGESERGADRGSQAVPVA